LYTTGGRLSSIEIYRYNPEEDYCSQLKKPHTNLFGSCVVTDEQYIYLIGGKLGSIFGGTPFSTTYRLDPSADDHEWEEVAAINQARYNTFGAAMNGKVYIGGGCLGQEALNTCEVYNPLLTDEWQLMPSLKVPRMSASMVCHEAPILHRKAVIAGKRAVGVGPHSLSKCFPRCASQRASDSQSPTPVLLAAKPAPLTGEEAKASHWRLKTSCPG